MASDEEDKLNEVSGLLLADFVKYYSEVLKDILPPTTTTGRLLPEKNVKWLTFNVFFSYLEAQGLDSMERAAIISSLAVNRVDFLEDKLSECYAMMEIQKRGGKELCN